MLITCNGCNSKIRVPDTAAGKRVKCPKCATMNRVLDADAPTSNSEPDAAISSPPLLPVPMEVLTPESFSTTPATSMPPTYEDVDDEAPSRHARRHSEYDDDEDDDFDVRRRGVGRRQAINGMAMTSMILGIVSVVCMFSSCGCGAFAMVALICAPMALIFGLIGKTPGSEAYAWTGIICGAVTLALLVLGILGLVGFVGINILAGPRGLR